MNSISGKIKLDDHFFIDVDPYNWALREIKTIPAISSTGKPNKGAGKQINRVVGYYSKLEDALDSYAELLAKESISTLSEPASLTEVKTILEEVKNAVAKVSLTLKVGQPVMTKEDAHDGSK